MKLWIVGLLIVCSVGHGPMNGGSSNAATSSVVSTPASLPVAIDGSLSPERIPDRVAYLHFVLANAEQNLPSTEELGRRRLLLSDVGLDESDGDALVNSLRGVREKLESIAESRRALIAGSSTATREAASSLKAQQDGLISDTVASLRSTLSPTGLELLEKYLRDHVKRHIVIYGDLPQ